MVSATPLVLTYQSPSRLFNFVFLQTIILVEHELSTWKLGLLRENLNPEEYASVSGEKSCSVKMMCWTMTNEAFAIMS